MKNIFLSFIFLTMCSSLFAQVEKFFTDSNFVYQVGRTHVRFLKLTVNGQKTKDTINTLLEVTNTGRYEYHPVAWHMVDSFLYAVEARRSDDLFVSFFLIRYTIPVREKGDKKITINKVRKSMKTLYYVQILNKYSFSISERSRKVEKPMYFDFIIDNKGLITVAILEVDKQMISLFSKSIAEHEKEQSDDIPLYMRVDTWKMLGAFSTTIQSPFRILKENNKHYVVDSDGILFEAKDKNLEKVLNKKTEPLALVFDKDAQKSVQYLSVKKLIKANKNNISNLRKYAKTLVDK